MTSIITQTDNMAFRYASLVQREDTTPPKTSPEFLSIQVRNHLHLHLHLHKTEISSEHVSKHQ